jgi:hypothetical protein
LLADRGAHVRDYGAKGDGAADDAPAIQAAIDDLKTRGGGTLLFGPRTYRLASPVVVEGATVRFQGAGFTEGPPPAQGTWLLVDTPGFTPLTFRGLFARGSAVRDIAVHQVHTATISASWAPTAYDFVVRVEDCFGGVDFDNLFLCPVNKGILCRNSGRLDIRRLRGQAFACAVEIDECYDVPRVHNVHLWPYWSGATRWCAGSRQRRRHGVPPQRRRVHRPVLRARLPQRVPLRIIRRRHDHEVLHRAGLRGLRQARPAGRGREHHRADRRPHHPGRDLQWRRRAHPRLCRRAGDGHRRAAADRQPPRGRGGDNPVPLEGSNNRSTCSRCAACASTPAPTAPRPSTWRTAGRRRRTPSTSARRRCWKARRRRGRW